MPMAVYLFDNRDGERNWIAIFESGTEGLAVDPRGTRIVWIDQPPGFIGLRGEAVRPPALVVIHSLGGFDNSDPIERRGRLIAHLQKHRIHGLVISEDPACTEELTEGLVYRRRSPVRRGIPDLQFAICLRRLLADWEAHGTVNWTLVEPDFHSRPWLEFCLLRLAELVRDSLENRDRIVLAAQHEARIQGYDWLSEEALERTGSDLLRRGEDGDAATAGAREARKLGHSWLQYGILNKTPPDIIELRQRGSWPPLWNEFLAYEGQLNTLANDFFDAFSPAQFLRKDPSLLSTITAADRADLEQQLDARFQGNATADRHRRALSETRFGLIEALTELRGTWSMEGATEGQIGECWVVVLRKAIELNAVLTQCWQDLPWG